MGFQCESNRKLSQTLWDAVSQALTDDSVWLSWILSFPDRADGHENRCLFKYREWTSSSSPTALGIVSSYGLYDVLQQILSSDVDTSTIERGALVVNVVDNLHTSPLSWAACCGHEKIAQLLLDRGADIETRDSEYGQTPLSRAAERGYVDVVRLLLDRGADIKTQDNAGRTPLSWAEMARNTSVIRKLLGRG
jgi:ankyrin repeat protein